MLYCFVSGFLSELSKENEVDNWIVRDKAIRF